ncbi:NUDIX domain-containing protein [Streptomyces mauvecolor]
MNPPKPRTPRQAARTVVRDPLGAVFLLRYDNEEVGPHWAMPGGGLDPGESPREGARRELREETGWTDLEPGPLLCTWTHDFTRAGIPVRLRPHPAQRGRRVLERGLGAACSAQQILRGWVPGATVGAWPIRRSPLGAAAVPCWWPRSPRSRCSPPVRPARTSLPPPPRATRTPRRRSSITPAS